MTLLLFTAGGLAGCQAGETCFHILTTTGRFAKEMLIVGFLQKRRPLSGFPFYEIVIYGEHTSSLHTHTLAHIRATVGICYRPFYCPKCLAQGHVSCTSPPESRTCSSSFSQHLIRTEITISNVSPMMSCGFFFKTVFFSCGKDDLIKKFRHILRINFFNNYSFLSGLSVFGGR